MLRRVVNTRQETSRVLRGFEGWSAYASPDVVDASESKGKMQSVPSAMLRRSSFEGVRSADNAS